MHPPPTEGAKMSDAVKEGVSKGSIERLVRCPWCASLNVWTYAWQEWRCEACTREWTVTLSSPTTSQEMRGRRNVAGEATASKKGTNL